MTRVIKTALLAISVCTADTLEQLERSLASKTYCPPEKSGRVPTDNCQGYVECINGDQGNNHFDCPPGTIFDVSIETCNWPNAVAKCSPYIAYTEGFATNELVTGTNYCPAEYTGRAPTSRCLGYVNCVSGEPNIGANCPSKTTFDSKTQMCISGMKDCKWTEGMEVYEEIIQLEGDEPEELEDELEESERIVFPRDCSRGYTGKAAIGKCTGYIECNNGVETARYNCTAGTLFDRSIGLCNWKNSVFCATSSPSMKPTFAPSTLSPTPFDPNNVYYPKFAEGICVKDGKQPQNVSSKYLFSDLAVCCKTYFSTNPECPKRTAPPTSAPIKWEPKVWYPDYVNHFCKKDGKYGPYEQNFFDSYDECCKFDFMDEAKCMENKPPMYYADYNTNTCTSHGDPSPYEDMLFRTHEECCQYDWIDTENCISSGDTLVQNSAATAPNPSLTSLGLWYPDKNSNRCKNDGKNAGGVLVFTSYQVCCFRSMPNISEKCELNSRASMRT
ncbi:hypothetical protein ACHAXM_008313 [Skeletonema potamos]